MIQVLKELDKPKMTYILSLPLEEVGIVGASVAAFDIMPDMAVAIDVTAGPDLPNPLREWASNLEEVQR